ncbi:hypothetical protein SADUNF_Sadunf18G0003800 [Salix dunnii]|uniref:FAS1 domain-containing protein n=1 Tax=Salix dunnii TaxID=1413687 RepID=A0A835J348_9ROSI|nr:hypothetical protein SADUNF_Sadunf18G0003800 [Salix dunnii]
MPIKVSALSASSSNRRGRRVWHHFFTKMDSKVSSLLFIAILCLLSSTSTAFNITKILAQYPEFANFNDLLTQSGLAQEINGRETITVLALDNSSIDGLSGRPVDIARRILSAHVILDYYDQTKLSKLQKASTIVTTLFQASGIADDRQGFLNVSKTAEGIKFGSAMKGAPLVASLVKSVYAQPYNISVLQVSEPIEAPGIENMAPPPPPAAVPKKAPAPAPTAKTPPAAPPTAKSSSKAPAPSKVEPSTPTESPTEGPVAADVPAASPLADAPLADETTAEAPAKAASSQMHVGGAVVVVGLLACMMGF